MSAASSPLRFIVALASFIAAVAPAQTLLFERLGANAGDQIGRSVAFGSIDDPNGPNPMRVVAVGQPLGSPPIVKVFDAAGNVVLTSPLTVLINEYGAAVAFGKIAPVHTPNDVLICGAPAPNVYSSGGVVVLHTPTSTLPTIPGTQANERFGHSVAVIGDVNATGIDDFIVGAPSYDSGTLADAGRVRVYQGGGTYNFIREHVGFQQGGHFGWSVSGIGDADGDGVPDYIVGMPDYDNTSLNPNVGRAHVYSGASGALIRSHLGVNDDERYGYAVAGCGDLNADGRPDYAIGAPETTLFPGSGRVDVRSGLDGSVIYALSAPGSFGSGHFGTSLAGGHDVDRDGVPDLVVGVPGAPNGGLAQVYSGRTGTPSCEVRGSQSGEAFGQAVALGQLNADDYAEFAIGRPLYDLVSSLSDQGAVSIYTGAIHWRFNWPTVGILKSVDVTGDVNGDGFDDLIIGGWLGTAAARGWKVLDGRTSQVLRQDPVIGTHVDSVSGLADVSGDGRADFIIGMGATNTVEVRGGPFGNVLLNLPSTGPGSFGHAVADAGDLDGDLVHDIIVGAPTHNAAAGYVSIRSGATAAALAWHAGLPGANLGWSVAGAGDVNGDGTNDYIEGSPKAQFGIGESGMAQIKSGTSNTVIATILGEPVQDSHCGWSVDELGDINADGFDDVIVGEPDYDGASGVNCGRARVYVGSPGGVVLQFTIEGAANDFCGFSVAGVGDVDGDGRNDFAVGFPYGDSPSALNSGVVRIYSGLTGVLLIEKAGAASDVFGIRLGGVPWAGPDGRNEVVAGAQPFGPQGAQDYARLIQIPEAKTVTIGPSGCAGAPTLLTGTGSCASMLSGCSVPLGDPVEAPGLPILGEQLVLKITGAPANGLFYPFASVGPAVITPVGGGCQAYLNLAALITTLPPIPLDAAGNATVGLLLPMDPGLPGIQGVMQGLVLPAGGGFALSNAIRVTLGFANHGL
jgi:FG-GAP repeat